MMDVSVVSRKTMKKTGIAKTFTILTGQAAMSKMQAIERRENVLLTHLSLVREPNRCKGWMAYDQDELIRR